MVILDGNWMAAYSAAVAHWRNDRLVPGWSKDIRHYQVVFVGRQGPDMIVDFVPKGLTPFKFEGTSGEGGEEIQYAVDVKTLKVVKWGDPSSWDKSDTHHVTARQTRKRHRLRLSYRG
jgi:hypothetical protein